VKNDAPQDGGFMLLETIVAFSVAALVMTAAFELLSRNVTGIAHIDDTTRATLAAEAQLAALGIAEPLGPGTHDDALPGGLIRRTEIAPVFVAERAEGAVPLYRVRVTVAWTQGSLTREALRLAAP
jgi:hypothetical protein